MRVIGNHQEFDFSKEFFEQYFNPGKHGQIYDYADFIKKAADNEIKVAVAADILSLVKLTPQVK
jgi:glycine dehydrogenase